MGSRFDSYSFFDGTAMMPVTQVSWADYWRGVIPDGVIGQYLDEMLPFANSTGMYIYVEPGACMADNHRGEIIARKQLPVAAAHETRPRIDLLVARVVYGNENESYIELDIKTGTADVDPEPPSLVQSTGYIYEIGLAEIYVAAGVLTLNAEDVTDTRKLFNAGRQSFTFVNADSVALEKGMLVKTSNNTEEAVERAALEDLVIGVVESDYITPGARGLINTRAGEIAKIKCDEAGVSVGDVLIPSETILGYGHPGGVRFSGGIALQAKASGIIGHVKSLLTIFSKLPTQNHWYLVNDLVETDVLAAFQFVGRGSIADALTCINEADYTLVPTSTDVVWDPERGFYIPPKKAEGLDCDELYSQATVPLGAIFGYSGLSTTEANASKCAGGIVMSNLGSLLELHAWVNNNYTNGTLSVNRRSTAPGGLLRSNSSPAPAYGVVSCDWGEENALYYNGTEIGTTATGSTSSSGGENSYNNIFGQCSYSQVSYIGFYITAGVLYKSALSPSDHYELAKRIRGLGGTN